MITRPSILGKAGATRTLGELLDTQWRASCEVHGGEPRPTRTSTAQFALALISEVVELAQELNWKPWKKDKPVDRERALDELADVWAFTLLYTNLVIRAVDATPEDVEAAYMRKTAINLSRARGEVPDYGRKELLDGEAEEQTA